MLIKQDELVNTLSTLHYTYIKYPLGAQEHIDHMEQGFHVVFFVSFDKWSIKGICTLRCNAISRFAQVCTF
jgi:hypothetical protein